MHESQMRVFVRHDWHEVVKSNFASTLLKKAGPKHIKAAFEVATPEMADDIAINYLNDYPYNPLFISVQAFTDSPLLAYKQRIAALELTAKGAGRKGEKGKGRGKGKGKGKGRGKHQQQHNDSHHSNAEERSDEHLQSK